MIRTQIAVSLALLGVAGRLHASVINVPADFPNIQQAVNAAVAGDEIVVAPGIYAGFSFAGKAVTVRGTDLNNPALTTLNGAGVSPVVGFTSAEGPNSRLQGFLINNGFAVNGGGILAVGSSPTIENCIISGNQASQLGGGMYATGAPTIRECLFVGNIAGTNGGGLYAAAASNPTIDGCRFEGNDAPIGSGLQLVSAALAKNCEVFDNVGGLAVAVNGTAAVTLVNCDVVGHAAAGIVVNGGATVPLLVANCIVRNNGGGQILGPAGMITVRYSNVQGGSAGPGNINLNPMFVNPAVDDFRLQPTSPCIDAGENATLPAGTIEDFGGVDRRSDRASVVDTGLGTAPLVDIGAHEFAPPRRYVNAAATGLNHGQSWSNAYLDLQSALADARVAGSEITEVWVAKGTYKPDGGTGDRSRSFEMITGVEIVGGFVGGETSVSLNDPVANQTILSGAIGNAGDGDNSWNVVRAINVSDDGTLIGFIVQRGNANDPAGPHELGGGIYIDGGAPAIRECWVRNCLATGGGGGLFSFVSDPNIVRCRFSLNESDAGGGGLLIWGGGPQVINCVISGNHADSDGGGMSVIIGTDLELTNCTIVGNTAGTGNTGGVLNSGDLIATNDILWQNVGAAGTVEAQQLRNSGGTIDLDRSIVQGLTGVLGGVGNMGTAPQFVDGNGLDNLWGTADDDPHLSAGSPGIDSGDSAALPGFVTLDYDGNTRFFDDYTVADTGVGSPAYVDRGAFEFQAVSCVGEIVANGAVDVNDLLAIITHWGACPLPCPPRCAQDIAPSPGGDCLIDVNDLLAVITHWGTCP